MRLHPLDEIYMYLYYGTCLLSTRCEEYKGNGTHRAVVMQVGVMPARVAGCTVVYVCYRRLSPEAL